MTVTELTTLLQSMPPDAEVLTTKIVGYDEWEPLPPEPKLALKDSSYSGHPPNDTVYL